MKTEKNITNKINCHHCHKRVTVSQKSHIMYVTIRMIFPKKKLIFTGSFKQKHNKKCCSVSLLCFGAPFLAILPKFHEKYMRNTIATVTLGVNRPPRKVLTYIHIYMYMYTHIHTYIHAYIHTYYTHTYIHTYTHTYMYTYIHTYVHTYMKAFSWISSSQA